MKKAIAPTTLPRQVVRRRKTRAQHQLRSRTRGKLLRGHDRVLARAATNKLRKVVSTTSAPADEENGRRRGVHRQLHLRDFNKDSEDIDDPNYDMIVYGGHSNSAQHPAKSQEQRPRRQAKTS